MSSENQKDNEVVVFKCLDCGIGEEIPRDVVELFHETDDGDISVPPRFRCENCGGIM